MSDVMASYIRRVAFAAALTFVVGRFTAPTVRADAVPPVQVMVKELPSGAFSVQWSVPKVIPPRSMPSPQLPESCRPDGERTFLDQPVAWLSHQVHRCPEGLYGQPLGVRFPNVNLGLSTLLRVEFLSGDRYAHMLNPGEYSWQIPEASADSLSNFYREAQRAALDGVDHFLGAWVHLIFLLMIAFVGGARGGIRLATLFLVAQVAAVVTGSLFGVALPAPLAEIGVALAVVLLAREALRPPDSRKQLGSLVACAGMAHGLGIPNFVSLSEPSAPYLLLVVLGMDAAILIVTLATSGLGELFAGRLSHSRITTAAVYGIGGAAFAFAIGALVNRPALATDDSARQVDLPSMMTPGSVLPGSRRVASNLPDAAIQSFISVEAFEVRHEILVRLKDVTELVEVSPGLELEIEAQDDVKKRIRDLVLTSASLEIDGAIPTPASERTDFMTLDEQGALPRPTPVPENVESAWVGVTAAYFTKTTARDLSLTWLDEAFEVPATVSDPESSFTTTLTTEEPVLRWKNELVEDPVPTVTALAVEPAMLIVPPWSLAPLAAAALFGAAAFLRRRPVLFLALGRVMLVIAVLAGPLGNMAIAVPFSVDSAPGTGEAKLILGRVLPNIYRAFEFREESAAFDRLALSVTGDTLTEIYLGHRRVLEMEERGGARARVVAVEVLDVHSVEPDGAGGFTAQAAWTVGGTVTHFGHRHFRQNRFDARVAVVPDQGIWKLRFIEVLNEERLQ